MNDCKFLVKKQLGKHKSQIVPTLWDALELQMENALDREVTQIFQSWRLTKRKTQKKTNKPQKKRTNKWSMQPMDVQNAANGHGNGEGAGDPPVLPDLEIHQKKNTKGKKQTNKKNGACSRCLCILSSNAQEKLCLGRSQCRTLVSQAVSQAAAFAALCAFRVRHYSVAAWN